MKRVFSLGIIGSTLLAAAMLVPHASAAEPGNFSLQVSPSPLVTTLKPGETKTLDLKVRNVSTAAEELKIEARGFKVGATNSKVDLDTTKPAAEATWVRFSEPRFTVKQGELKNLTVTIALPKDTGFSYSFALVISRANPVKQSTGRSLEGSVAIFTLINVDRPGATRKVELSDVKAKKLYEYLPADIELVYKNTGNTIVQPYGNVFIQRKASDTKSLATLPANQTEGYLLPGVQRSLTTTWSDGFPVYKTVTDATGQQKRSIQWNLDKVTHFRIGKYTAKVVAVYNDGQRDVPLVKEVTFWVFPWKAFLSLLLLITGLVLLGRYFAKRRTEKAVNKALAARKQS